MSLKLNFNSNGTTTWANGDNKAKPGQKYCIDCGSVYANKREDEFICPSCRDKILSTLVVYDRDRNIGQLPANLRKYIDA